MHYIGIDLAWGGNKPTGVAVIDAGARLLHVGAVRTDDEIVRALTPFTAGDCVVAIDAPLVVENETGMRPAERQLSKDFRRYDAGTHPSNTGKPEFANGTRGSRVARLLGLELDPTATSRRALEVYPHPATVVLFGLPKVLRYKAKPGRDLELLRSELLVLMSHVESIVTTDQAWASLRTTVETATKKAELRRVEDQVDAVVCAYIALFADTRPGDVTTYGDAATGAIVTPTLGTPALVTTRDEVVRDAVRAYGARHAELTVVGEEAVALVRGLLDEAGINYLSVTGRTKSVASFAEKVARRSDGQLLYDDPLTQITDVVGVRVITYVRDDVDAVAEVLAEQLTVTIDRDLGQETAQEGRFGYASRHLLLDLDGSADGPAAPALGGVAQVQVRTVLQHAWAEFEHDIRYKGTVPAEHVGEFDRRFTLAAGLLELADREFSEIRERLRGATPEPVDVVVVVDDDPRLDQRELAAFLAGQYSDAAWSRTDHYGWIAELLLELGITSLAELGDVLRGADEAAIAARMDYRHPPGAVRRVDDALLSVFGERYVGLHGNGHRRPLLEQRLERLRSE